MSECPLGLREKTYDTFGLPEECIACFEAAIASPGAETVDQPNVEQRLARIASLTGRQVELEDYHVDSIERHGEGPKRTMTRMEGKRDPAAFDAQVITQITTVDFDCLRTE